MKIIKESDMHLFQPPIYRGSNGKWFTSYKEALAQSDTPLTWDLAAILSILSFNYVCGNRTLVSEITRKPWLSRIGHGGEAEFTSIPPHGRIWNTYRQIAENLEKLLFVESLEACQGHDEIYVLLSGGLDSRITAGIIAKLWHEGKLANKPIAVTWGQSNSRDVVYGREVARILGFEWIHINIDPQQIIRNLEADAITLGGIVSPMHLHAMLWFDKVSKDAIVMASSYGDMVGRAEFAKKHLLELDYLKPVNKFGLISSRVLAWANDQLTSDLRALHARSPGQPKYVQCEYEMHCNYTRGMLGHAMSIINKHCTVYQMFTHPNTYSYMWLIHPALRVDAVYAELLNLLGPQLLHIPWARTNKAIRGKTSWAEYGIKTDFHDYQALVSGPVYHEIKSLIDLDWFESTGLFNVKEIQTLCGQVGKKPLDLAYYDTFLWLACFRRFADWVNGFGKQVELPKLGTNTGSGKGFAVRQREISKVRQYLSRSKFLQQLVKNVRRPVLRLAALIKYPPNRQAA